MKRAVVFLLGAVLTLAVAVPVALVLLAQSERGTRLLVDAAERYLPMRFAGVGGALAHGVRVDQVTIVLEDRELIVRGLAIELGLVPLLFENRLDVTDVRADSVELTERTEPFATDPPKALQLPFVPVDIELEALEIARLQIPGVPVAALRGRASWNSAGLSVHQLVLSGEALEAEATGTLSAGSHPALDATVEWALPLAGWQGHGEFAGPLDELTVRHEAIGPWRVEARGLVKLGVPAEPGFDLTVAVDPIVRGEFVFDAIAGQVTGTLESFAVEARAQANTPYGAPFPVRVDLRGAAGGPAEFDVRGEPLAGEVVATGTVAWAGGLDVTARGSASDLTLDPLLEGLAGRVGARFEVDYQADAFDIALHDLAGEIDGRRLSGQATVHGSGRSWRAEAVELALGDNRAAFDGAWNDAVLDAAGRVDAPALEQLGLGMTGALAGEFDVNGQWPAISGSVSFASPEFAMGAVRLSALTVDGAMADGALTGRFSASRLESGTFAFETVSLVVKGPLDRLEWGLAWAGGAAGGTLAHAAGDSRFDVTRLGADAAGRRFAIEQPFAITRASTGAVGATPVCVVGADARACVAAFRFDQGRIATAGRLERLPVALLEDFFPPALAGSGYFDGAWELEGAGADWTGTAELAAHGLQLAVGVEDDEPIALPDAELAGRFDGAGGTVTLRAVGPRISLEGAARLAPLAADGQLTGSATLRAADLGWLATFDQRIEDIGGAIDGKMTFAGTPAEPIVEGRIDLQDGRVVLQDPEMRLERIEAVARIDREGSFELNGTAESTAGAKDAGSVELVGGGIGLFGGDLAFEVALRGERLRATHPQWEVEIAPDLELTRVDGRTLLSGVVEVPRAAVRFETLPTSVAQPSVDVIVVGRETPAAAGSQTGALRVNVRVRLGREVQLSALGMQAGLRGELNVRRDARGQESVRGTLDVTGGRLTAQGQTLTIESGTVVYNGPVGNPYIDVRAVREIEDQSPPVKVGLHIQGDARRLTSTVFSEPAMAENRALAFLVLGRDIDQESETDSNQLLTAAINLGLSKSKSLTSELQRISGLDELSAVAEAEDSFAIAAGKRIGDSIYLRYTYNTLTAAGAILVNFDLTEHWQLEARSGETSAMDILYRFDR